VQKLPERNRQASGGRHRANRMARRPPGIASVCLVAGFLLVACQTAAVEPPSRAQLADELVRQSPPDGGDGICWATEVTPAIIETVTEQALATREVRDTAGQITTPASFHSTTRQRIVQDREEVWFRAPCPDEMTVEVVSTLQRALKARGLYRRALTGTFDQPTAEAVRRFQVERGLDSPQLSLAAAQELGIISTALDAI